MLKNGMCFIFQYQSTNDEQNKTKKKEIRKNNATKIVKSIAKSIDAVDGILFAS